MNTDNVSNLFSVTEVEIIYRNKTKASDRRPVKSSQDAYQLLLMAWDMNKIELVEQFKIILLDRKNSCIGIADISTGGVTSCVADARIIFSTALKAMATGLVLSHNHPSGNLLPSAVDIELTKKLAQAGKFLEIDVLDHLIVTPSGYYSMADEGLMP